MSKIPVISAVGHEVDFTSAILSPICERQRRRPPPRSSRRARSSWSSSSGQRRRTWNGPYRISCSSCLCATRRSSCRPYLSIFRTSIERLSCDVGDLKTRLETGFRSVVDFAAERLERFDSQLTPLSLTSKLGAARTSLAVFAERHRTAVRRY